MRQTRQNCYLKPSWTQNGSIRTDLPLMVVPKTMRRKIREIASPGQLLCVGEVYLRTHDNIIRIK